MTSRDRLLGVAGVLLLLAGVIFTVGPVDLPAPTVSGTETPAGPADAVSPQDRPTPTATSGGGSADTGESSGVGEVVETDVDDSERNDGGEPPEGAESDDELEDDSGSDSDDRGPPEDSNGRGPPDHARNDD